MPLDDGTEITILATRYHVRLIQRAMENAAQTLAMDLAFDLENEQVQQVLDTLTKQVTSVAETTRQEIRDLTGQAAREGWSVGELAARIKARGSIASTERATLISRTESAAAYSRGSLLAYRQSGVVSGSQWLIADEACPICQPLADVVTPLGEAFADGIEAPPAHPACRCSVAPVLSEGR